MFQPWGSCGGDSLFCTLAEGIEKTGAGPGVVNHNKMMINNSSQTPSFLPPSPWRPPLPEKLHFEMADFELRVVIPGSKEKFDETKVLVKKWP